MGHTVRSAAADDLPVAVGQLLAGEPVGANPVNLTLLA